MFFSIVCLPSAGFGRNQRGGPPRCGGKPPTRHARSPIPRPLPNPGPAAGPGGRGALARVQGADCGRRQCHRQHSAETNSTWHARLPIPGPSPPSVPTAGPGGRGASREGAGADSGRRAVPRQHSAEANSHVAPPFSHPPAPSPPSVPTAGPRGRGASRESAGRRLRDVGPLEARPERPIPARGTLYKWSLAATHGLFSGQNRLSGRASSTQSWGNISRAGPPLREGWPAHSKALHLGRPALVGARRVAVSAPSTDMAGPVPAVFTVEPDETGAPGGPRPRVGQHNPEVAGSLRSIPPGLGARGRSKADPQEVGARPRELPPGLGPGPATA